MKEELVKFANILKLAADPVVEEKDEGVQLENELGQLKITKKRFIKEFYKELLDARTRIKGILDKEDFGYLGVEKKEIINNCFNNLISTMEEESNKFEATITVKSSFIKEAIDKQDIIKNIYKYFIPILNVYKRFEKFMIRYPEFAEKFSRTRTSFLNLKNVISNIVESIPEQITNIKLIKD